MRFLGGESWKNNPFLRLRVGKVLEVYADENPPTPSTVPQDRSMGSIKVEWLDWGGERDLIQVAFPYFSNPMGNGVEVGLCYGDICLPSQGDIAIIGFRDPNTAIVLGYLPLNYKEQTSDSTSKSSNFGTMRRISSGEMSRKSKQQAEIYQDKAGAVQIIVQAQLTDNDDFATDGSATDKVTDIDPALAPAPELARVIVGETYTDDTFTTRKKSSAGNKVIVEVRTTVGAGVIIDTAGNVEITAAARKDATLKGGTSQLTTDGGESKVIVSDNGVEINIASGQKLKIGDGSGTPAPVLIYDPNSSANDISDLKGIKLSTLITSTH